MNTSTEPSGNGGHSTIVQRYHPDGVTTSGIRKPAKTYNRVKSDNHPSPPSSDKSQYGSQGITHNGQRELRNSLHILSNQHGHSKLLWTVITYTHASDEAIANIAKDIDKVRTSIKKHLDKIKCPYAVSIGIQDKLSYQYEIPCYDINICFPSTLNNLHLLIDSIYRSLSKIARETIAKPVDLYSEPIINDESNFNRFVHYFVNQVHDESIYQKIVSQWRYPLPKTWTIIQGELKESCKPIKNEVVGDSLDGVKETFVQMGYQVINSNKQKLVTVSDNLANYCPSRDKELFNYLMDKEAYLGRVEHNWSSLLAIAEYEFKRLGTQYDSIRVIKENIIGLEPEMMMSQDRVITMLKMASRQ